MQDRAGGVNPTVGKRENNVAYQLVFCLAYTRFPTKKGGDEVLVGWERGRERGRQANPLFSVFHHGTQEDGIQGMLLRQHSAGANRHAPVLSGEK